MKKQLPITFRINGSGRFAESLIEKLSGDFLGKFSADGEGLVMEGQTISPPKPLPWYPNNLAWQLGFSRRDLRRIPEMKPLHEFIKAETEMGAITRQEAVSMIPPLFLDVHPHHRVLDMCAAPGTSIYMFLCDWLGAAPVPLAHAHAQLTPRPAHALYTLRFALCRLEDVPNVGGTARYVGRDVQ